MKPENQALLNMMSESVTVELSAYKTAFILNGASAVAVLAFIAHLATEETKLIGTFPNSLYLFAAGAFMAAMAKLAAYLSYYSIDETLSHRFYSQYYLTQYFYMEWYVFRIRSIKYR